MANLRKEAGETWVGIEGYQGFYQVSTFGRVRSLPRVDRRGQKRKERLIKPYRHGSKGYVAVCLSREGDIQRFRLHRLVAETFIKRVEGKDYVNHKNGNKSDNRAENLEWVTVAENNLHAFRTLNRSPSGGGKGQKGAQCSKSKPVIATRLVSSHVCRFESASEAAEHLGVSVATVSRACNGKVAYVRGFSLRYEYDLP